MTGIIAKAILFSHQSLKLIRKGFAVNDENSSFTNSNRPQKLIEHSAKVEKSRCTGCTFTSNFICLTCLSLYGCLYFFKSF